MSTEMHELQNFPIRGKAWLLDRQDRHFVIWQGVTAGNQERAIAYQTDPDGYPLPGWHELVNERTVKAALAALSEKVRYWPGADEPDA